MIMSGNVSHRLTWSGCAALMGLGVILLPLAPAWAQDRKENPPANKADAKEIDKARAEVDKLRDELEDQVRKIKAVEDKLRSAASRLHKLEGKSGDVRVIIIRDGDHQQGGSGRPWEGGWRGGSDPNRGQPQGGDRRFDPFGGDRGPGGGGDHRGGPGNFQPGPGQGGDRGPGPGGRPGDGRPGDFRPGPGPGGPSGPGGNDQRIQELERKLDHVMRILEEMRRPMQGSRPGGPGPMGPGGSGGPPRPMGPGSGDRSPER